MSEQTELLPCPFCGAAADTHTGCSTDGRPWWHVQCTACLIGTDGDRARADAVAAWNNRPAVQAEVRAIIELIRFKADQYAKGGDMTFSHLLALADQITDGWHLRIDELRQRLRDAYGSDEEAQNGNA